MLIGDLIEDLSDFAVEDIADACHDCRCNAKQKFFPNSGELREYAGQARKERAARAAFSARADKFDSRPLMWWTQRRAFWKPHWRESEIPAEWRDAFNKAEAKRNAQ